MERRLEMEKQLRFEGRNWVRAGALFGVLSALMVLSALISGCVVGSEEEPDLDLPKVPRFEVMSMSPGTERLAGQDVQFIDFAVKNTGEVEAKSFRLTANLLKGSQIVDEASEAWAGLLRPDQETTLRLRFLKITSHDAYDAVDYTF